MSYGPHHHPLKAIDVAGTTALIVVFAATITGATLGALDLLTFPPLAWGLVFAILPWIQAQSIREYAAPIRPYLKSVMHMAKLGASFINFGISHLLFTGAEQTSDSLLRISCWVLIAAFPALNAIILAYCAAIADLILNDRVLPWLRPKR